MQNYISWFMCCFMHTLIMFSWLNRWAFSVEATTNLTEITGEKEDNKLVGLGVEIKDLDSLSILMQISKNLINSCKLAF